MVKIFIHVAGNTLHSHEEFVRELLEKGAEEVNSPKDSNVSIVFCPIVSRFEIDKKSALSTASGKRKENAQKSYVLVVSFMF